MSAYGSDAMIVRDLIGYGERLPDPQWPGKAVIAVNFNLNVEGGGEATLANGDFVSEGMLNDIGVGTKAGRRVPLVEFGLRVRKPPRRVARPRRVCQVRREDQRPGGCPRA